LLNEAESGEPISCINSPTTSIVRTAAVSGAVLRRYLAARDVGALNVGICGFGPIGQAHADMVLTEFADFEPEIRVFDVREGLVDDWRATDRRARVTEVSDWRHAHDEVDVFITCTTTSKRYVDRATKHGSLMLNVSLRDFETSVFSQIDRFVVDDWTEVCRENTDIERMAEECGLSESDVETLVDVVVSDSFRSLREDEVIMVSPMGMACFDITVARHLYDRALQTGIGTALG
jgi:ornithine cyclodeaminase